MEGLSIGDLTHHFQYSIVAVHGLNGDAYKTWTSDKGDICWLNDKSLLPKYLPKARILTWGYNANVTAPKGGTTSADRILQHAHTLVAQLHADRKVRSNISISSKSNHHSCIKVI